MNTLQEMIFISEIVLQSNIAQRAYQRLKSSNDIDRIEIWSSIQSILVASANVSKILWPQKKYESRGETLRNLLHVKADNLLANRKFRNHFEHYDERIEKSFEKNPPRSYRDLSMNPSLSKFGFQRTNRGYNSFNNTIEFRGEKLDLTVLFETLEKIKLSCKPYVISS